MVKLATNLWSRVFLVPTLRVGMQVGRSASPASARRRASRRHSHAERGNEQKRFFKIFRVYL